VDCCRRRLDGGEPLFSFASAKENANASLPAYAVLRTATIPQSAFRLTAPFTQGSLFTVQKSLILLAFSSSPIRTVVPKIPDTHPGIWNFLSNKSLPVYPALWVATIHQSTCSTARFLYTEELFALQGRNLTGYHPVYCTVITAFVAQPVVESALRLFSTND